MQMKSLHLPNFGAWAVCLLAVACESNDTPKVRQVVADRYLFNHIFCPVVSDDEKAVREIDFAKTAFVGWLRGEFDYQDYLFAWLKENSKREIVEEVVISYFLHADIKRNAVNEKIAIVGKSGRPKYLLDNDDGFQGFYDEGESSRILIIQNFCDQVFPAE
jgi:hypothetical protein